jgi:hypothetical protein
MTLCETNQKIALTPSVILPLDESESSVPNIIYYLDADIAYLLLYIEDIVLTTSSSELLQSTTAALQWEFAMKVPGPLYHFLHLWSSDMTTTSSTSANTLSGS